MQSMVEGGMPEFERVGARYGARLEKERAVPAPAVALRAPPPPLRRGGTGRP